MPPPMPTLIPNMRSRKLNGSISPRIIGISCADLTRFAGNAFLEELKQTVSVNDNPLQPEEVANYAVHAVTLETITKYKKVIDDPHPTRHGVKNKEC